MISRSALGRPFLLAPLVVLQTASPEVEYLKARLVAFRDNGHEIALFEYNPHVLYEDLGAQKLIASFPAVARTKETIRFRCVPFLPALSLAPSWGTSDSEKGFAQQIAASEPVLAVVDSWGSAARTLEDGVRLSQVVRLAVPQKGEHVTATVEVDLWSHRPNPGFAALPSTRQEKVGFFEVPLTAARTGDVSAIAMRWDLSPDGAPITVRVTRNVPPELRGAVLDAIAYWNRALGWDALRAADDASPGALPARREILIRWVTWDSAGFSQASFQAHPLTGEILRAEVMLTSAFADARAVAFAPAASADVEPDAIAWPGRACRRAAPGGTGPGVRSADLGTKASQDRVRAVTAHEIGHALGLRHNFAGSLETEFATPEDHARAWRAYLGSGGTVGARTSSSVMDYLDPLDELLLGEKIRDDLLSYDLLAARWAYRGAPIDAATPRPAFCTDSAAGTRSIVGCDRFDAGANPLALAAEGAAFRIARLPAELVAAMTTPQTPGEILALPPPELRAERIGVNRVATAIIEPVIVALLRAREGAAAWSALDRSAALPIAARFDAARRSTDELLAQAGGARGLILAAAGPLAEDPEWLVGEVKRVLAAGPGGAAPPVDERTAELTIAVAQALGEHLIGKLSEVLEVLGDGDPERDDVEDEDEDVSGEGETERRATERGRRGSVGR